jgi:glycosyltransferase involved in cell wall biosynthesis
MPRRIGEIIRTLTYTLWLLLRLARGRYDVLHLHGNYWFGLAPTLVSGIFRTPLVLKVTRLGDDDAFSITQKRFGRIPIGRLYSMPTRAARLVITLNREIAQRHHVQFPTVLALSLPNAVDVNRFQPTSESRALARAELGIPKEAAVALFVGYVTPRKGVSELLDAWHQIALSRSETPNNAFLLLVGPDCGVYRELAHDASIRAASDSARDEGVRVLRHISGESMPAVYAAADVFVLPTRSEGMPNSLLEALAAGLLVIASRVPGVIEVVSNDPSTILLDSVSVDNIRNAVNDCFARAHDVRAARVPRWLTLEEVSAAYVEIYRALIKYNTKSTWDTLKAHLEPLGRRW